MSHNAKWPQPYGSFVPIVPKGTGGRISSHAQFEQSGAKKYDGWRFRNGRQRRMPGRRVVALLDHGDDVELAEDVESRILMCLFNR